MSFRINRLQASTALMLFLVYAGNQMQHDTLSS
jgi:hypothetical protein